MFLLLYILSFSNGAQQNIPTTKKKGNNQYAILIFVFSLWCLYVGLGDGKAHGKVILRYLCAPY